MAYTKPTDIANTNEEKDRAVEQLRDALTRLKGVSHLAAKLLDGLEAGRNHSSMMRLPDGYAIEHDF